MTETPELFEYEKQIQKVYDRLCICRARGMNETRQRQRYENMVRAWRLRVEQEEDNDGAE